MATYLDVYTSRVFLGEGTFGRVTKVIRKPDGKALACKTIRFAKDPRGKEAVELEYSALSRLQHPNIVRCEAIEWLRKEARLSMEYCDGTNLEDYMWANSRESDCSSEQDV